MSEARTTPPSRLNQAGELVKILNEFSRFAATAAFALVATAALAYPAWLKDRLGQLGLHIQEVDTGFVKLVANETAKAGTQSLHIAEGLNNAEVWLAELKEHLLKHDHDPAYAHRIEGAAAAIEKAKAALDQQATSLQHTGTAAGIASQPPARGWLYVGNFAANGQLRQLSPRLAGGEGLQQAASQLTTLTLRFDTPVTANGEDCDKSSSENFIPAHQVPEQQYTIVRATSTPLRVLASKRCPPSAQGSAVYAQVEIPGDRIRFRSLQALRP